MCLVCHAPSPRDVLCALCRAALPWLFNTCARCGLPRCGPCPAATQAFDVAWAPMQHDGIARDLLLALKLRGALPAANLMAEQMLERAPPDVLAGDVVVVPVPGHSERVRRRGFDPARAIARAVARRGGAEAGAGPWPVFEGLQRARVQTRQLGRRRGGRLDRGAMTLSKPVRPAAIALLVDDVHTTGATLHACAEALEPAGFLQIAAVTYVRTLTES
jgi:predicted amidophosphoribosyltransferase